MADSLRNRRAVETPTIGTVRPRLIDGLLSAPVARAVTAAFVTSNTVVSDPPLAPLPRIASDATRRVARR